MTLLRHLLAILALPAVVTLLVPCLILRSRAGGAGGVPEGEIPAALAVATGAAVILAGLGLVCTTVWQFATRGRGTLAPWDPPRHLVVEGVYRYVRNPMISGVLLVLLGEAVLFRSAELLVWAAVFFLVNATYIPLVEERGLERRFGEAYRLYARHVPRWVPRLTPWQVPAWSATRHPGG